MYIHPGNRSYCIFNDLQEVSFFVVDVLCWWRGRKSRNIYWSYTQSMSDMFLTCTYKKTSCPSDIRQTHSLKLSLFSVPPPFPYPSFLSPYEQWPNTEICAVMHLLLLLFDLYYTRWRYLQMPLHWVVHGWLCQAWAFYCGKHSSQHLMATPPVKSE